MNGGKRLHVNVRPVLATELQIIAEGRVLYACRRVRQVFAQHSAVEGDGPRPGRGHTRSYQEIIESLRILSGKIRGPYFINSTCPHQSTPDQAATSRRQVNVTRPMKEPVTTEGGRWLVRQASFPQERKVLELSSPRCSGVGGPAPKNNYRGNGGSRRTPREQHPRPARVLNTGALERPDASALPSSHDYRCYTTQYLPTRVSGSIATNQR
jgi:hypothetical protein